MDALVQRVEELTRKLISERKMKCEARAERDRALRRADEQYHEIKRLRKELAAARVPFSEDHERLVEVQFENVKLKRMIAELEEKHGLQERDH